MPANTGKSVGGTVFGSHSYRCCCTDALVFLRISAASFTNEKHGAQGGRVEQETASDRARNRTSSTAGRANQQRREAGNKQHPASDSRCGISGNAARTATRGLASTYRTA